MRTFPSLRYHIIFPFFVPSEPQLLVNSESRALIDIQSNAVSDVALERFRPPSCLTGPLFSPSLMNSIDAVGDFPGLSWRRVRVIQQLSFQPRHWIF